MEKVITTGTEITFKKTGDKFSIEQTEIGFKITPLKLTKKNESEEYSYQEIMDLYESGKISFEGFDDEKDSSHVKSILVSYMHQSIVKTQLQQIKELSDKITELSDKNKELEDKNKELEKAIIAATAE